jgi:uncharacterized phage-associated protein
VCVELYKALKDKSVLYSDLEFDGSYDPDPIINENLTSSQIEIMEQVLTELSTWKDYELEAATHREAPWVEARAGIPASQKHSGIISKITTTDFYRGELN